MPSMPNDTDDARDSERGNQYDNHAQQKRSTRLPPPTFALTLSAGDSPDSADRVASQPGVFGGSHLSPLVETTAAQLEANLPTDDNEPTSSHSLLDYASASASNNDFLQDQPYGYTGATQLVSSKDSLNVWIVPPRHNTSVDAIPKYPSAETIKSTTNRQTPVLGESGMRLSGGELVSAASKSTYASIPDSSSTPISSSGQGSGHVIHSFTTSQSGFNHGFGSGHLSTAPVSAKRRRSTVTFSLNAEPFEVDPYFFMENAEQDSGPPPILPPWISPPRPILRRHSHMPTAVPSSQPTSTETSDSSHSFTGQLCMNANGPSSALSVIKTTSQPSTAVTRLPGSESPSAASIAIPRHRHTYAWSTAGLLSRVVEPVCSSMTAYMANPQSRVWQFLNYLKRSLDIFYLLSVPVSIAFICEVTFGFFHLFAAADLLLYVAVLLDMLRPRRNAYGVFPTDPVEQHHLYWRSTRNRLKLLACVPLDWALFFLRLSRGSWDEGYMCQHHIHVFFGSDGSSSLTPPDSTSGVTLLGSSARFLYSNRDIPTLELEIVCFRLVRLFHCVDTLSWLHHMRIPFVSRAFSRLFKNLLVAVYLSLVDSCLFWFTSSRSDHARRFINKYLIEDGIPTSFLERFVNNYVAGQGSLFFIVRDVQIVTEAAYQAVEMLVAAIVYGSIFGNFVAIVRSLDNQAAFDKTVKSRNFKKAFLRQYLIDNQFPAALQQRILDQEEFDFLHKKGMDVDEIIASMPKTMQHDIHMHLYAGLIDKVPMFSKTDQAFKLALMNRITSISVQAGFYIFRAHDAASELYFVKQGAVHVMSADETTTFVTLHSGSFFGEIALLEDCTRTATVKTAVDTELCVLSKPDFLAILGQFPAAAELIAQSVREKREADAKRKADEEEKARLRQKEDRADNAVTSLRSRLLGKRPFGSKNALAGESKLTLPGFSSIRRGHRSIVASMRSLTGGGGGGGGGGGAVGSRRQSVFGSKASVFNPPAALASQQTCSNDLTDPEAARAMTDGSSCSISSPSASERYAPKLPSVPVTPPATLKRGQSIATCEASGV